MPELPEVETVRRGLAPSMEGQIILQADVNRPDLRWPFPDRMAERLTGTKVIALRRRSKYVLADLDTGETLIIHLGMSGNIYVCEVLFRAGINPKRKAGALSKGRVAALVPIIRDVLGEAIQAGGSSLKDYRQADGELGYFQHGFQAYDREGHACQKPLCGGEIARIVQSGRSTFYCPKCQR